MFRARESFSNHNLFCSRRPILRYLWWLQTSSSSILSLRKILWCSSINRCLLSLLNRRCKLLWL